MSERKTVSVDLHDEQDFEDLTGNLAEVIAWLQETLNEAPEEFRPAVKIEVECYCWSDGESDLTCKIYYERPETDAEMAARIEQDRREERARRAHTEAEERAVLAALKKKYEP